PRPPRAGRRALRLHADRRPARGAQVRLAPRGRDLLRRLAREGRGRAPRRRGGQAFRRAVRPHRRHPREGPKGRHEVTTLVAALVDGAVMLALALIAAALLRSRTAALRHAVLTTAVLTAAVMPILELVLPQLRVTSWGHSGMALSSGLMLGGDVLPGGAAGS